MAKTNDLAEPVDNNDSALHKPESHDEPAEKSETTNPPQKTENNDSPPEKIESSVSNADAASTVTDPSSSNDTDQSMKCEIKYLDQKTDREGNKFFTEREKVENPEQKKWWTQYAFCQVRTMTSSSPEPVYTTTLYVNAEPLKQLFRDAVSKYAFRENEGASDNSKDEGIGGAPACEGTNEAKKHRTPSLELLLSMIQRRFETEIDAYNTFLTSRRKMIDFKNLWILFSPGTIVRVKDGNRHHACRVRRCTEARKRAETDGWVKVFEEYPEPMELSDLDIAPLNLLEDADDMRGRKFESLVGQHYLRYEGIGRKRDWGSREVRYRHFSVQGHVMIDTKTFFRFSVNDAFTVKSGLVGTKSKLSAEDAPLTNPRVRGYCFCNSAFLELLIDDLQPVEWDPHCFEALVLDSTIKKTVQALGKGRGLVCVLHGPPGVGKTLTAECDVKRALFTVSSGDLGKSTVLLIDEADVFLEQRENNNLQRNAMVSVFLRLLEYYPGIMFPTNRVRTFDDAFKSRIHISIRYTNLTRDAREKIWRNLCERVPGGVDITDRGYRKLAGIDLNGGQIKNTIKAAESLAAFDHVRIDLKQLQDVANIQTTFEKDMSNPSGVDYTAKGERKHDGPGLMFT
ncbi:hypothetical protein B0T16DRAFT_434259 [Cercophora newfieldiana]|uniref:AAA+ ATPase domain-containing protein n=1 Tax=Cercophora newfieldiana TaxID=92897 RepID=A0AA40CZZ2_9PEZI|nr:hypothetical protein B0T16DRAFT_434259 [Cercophora newfieldiana]